MARVLLVFLMNRKLEGLLEKLSRINHEMGSNDGTDKQKSKKGDRFHELKTRMGERLHQLKMTLQDNEVGVTTRGKHPREVIRRQQEIREEIRLAGIDLKDLTATFELENKKKRSKFSREELAMRKDIVTQYWAEYERIQELAAATYRSPAYRSTFDTEGVAAPIGLFENVAFTARMEPIGAAGGLVIGGGAVGSDERKVITNDQLVMLADINRNDQRFDNIIEQIGTGVQELDMQARMLNEELQQQAVMIDGLGERIETTHAHVESVNKKMKETLRKVGRGPDKCMMDMICLILLLGILAVLYNMLVKKGTSATTP
ncbi:hypothetical protein PsorP6_009665 [Peronosclerospora sorghi]|uniref:Uncharacterized protein n=1 Tax=Peronosclerospora sorghi TaxID=230839 RepID=A0ACC0VXK1_9STRA|nr:hypothetical protein PsorP6_009665 [Peronosclerospora sorghi]